MRHSFLLVFSIVFAASCGGEAAESAASGADAAAPAATAEPAAPPPAGEVGPELPRVVFLGTSLTAGLGLEDDGETYVARLAELGDSAGLPFQAVNAGVSGETSAGGLRRVDWILREPLDVLVLELGANDGLRGQDPAALERNLVEIIDRTRTRYPDALVLIAGMQAPPNFGLEYTARFGAVFPRVAESKGADLVPFLLDGVAGVPELNQDDRIHPTPEGHDLMARTVWPYLERLLNAAESG